MAYKFELVSPEQLLVSEMVESIVIPGSEGEMTVMANHAPLMAMVKPGVVTIRTQSGKDDRYVVFGGFADILPDGCTLLAESAVHVDDFNEADLKARIVKARSELGTTVEDHARTKLEEFLHNLTALELTVSKG